MRHIKEIILTANLGNGEKGVRASHIDQNGGRETVARFILIFANGGVLGARVSSVRIQIDGYAPRPVRFFKVLRVEGDDRGKDADVTAFRQTFTATVARDAKYVW